MMLSNRGGRKGREIAVPVDSGLFRVSIDRSATRESSKRPTTSGQCVIPFRRCWLLLPSKHPRFQFPRVSLHLIAMFIHASKEVSSAVHIEHDAL